MNIEKETTMKTYLASDLHFSHKNIAKFCPKTRGHWDTRNDPEKMNQDMIQMWNAIVQPEDRVYILGDVAFCSATEAVKILQQLNGSLILIEGNHDQKSLRDPAFRSCFKEIHKYYSMTYADTRVVMFHYPIAEWDQMHRGAVHFHGHLHGSVSGLEHYRARDAGFDATGKIVWLMEDAIADAKLGQIKGHH
jgi:calcineurin-like phosphoesterase family protein